MLTASALATRAWQYFHTSNRSMQTSRSYKRPMRTQPVNGEGKWKGESKWSPSTCYSRGCALLAGKFLKSVTKPNGRYILAKVKTNLVSVFNLVCVYAPDRPGKRLDFLNSLKQTLTAFCGNDPVIMAGDFNFVNRDRIGGNLKLSQFTRGSVEFDQIPRLFDFADTSGPESPRLSLLLSGLIFNREGDIFGPQSSAICH